jgi:hypothetical protein
MERGNRGRNQLVVVTPRVRYEMPDSTSSSRRYRGESEELGGGTPRVQDETPDVVSVRLVPRISLDEPQQNWNSLVSHPHTPCAI